MMMVESDVWYYKDALLRRDLASAYAARRGLRSTTARIVQADPYFVPRTGYFLVVWHAIESGDLDGAADELLAWHPTVVTHDVDRNNATRTTARQFTDSCVQFLEDTNGSRHPAGRQVYAAMLNVAGQIRGVLTSRNQQAIARVVGSRQYG